MSNIKTTDWFDGAKFVPYHVGVYETIHSHVGINTFQYWDSKNWRPYAPYVEHAYEYSNLRLSDYQAPQWRGIKK